MKRLLFFVFCVITFGACNSSLRDKDSTAITQDLLLTQPSTEKQSENQLISRHGKTAIDSGLISTKLTPPEASGQNSDWDKKIIKTAFLKLQVKDFKLFAGTVQKAARQRGGYIASEEQNQSEEQIESTLSIKVPVAQFELIMDELPSSAEKIIEKKITTEDVTGEVVDTKSRLQSKEQARLKYLEFLKQSKSMEDVLKVQSEINDIQEEMESAAGRINYLSHQSAFSTINLTFYQPLAGYSPGEPGFFTRSIAAFKTGFNSITEIIIGLISIWPFLFLLFAVWMLFKRFHGSVPSMGRKS